MNNVNNPTGAGAAGFPNTPTPEAPRNTPEGTCFGGRKVVINVGYPDLGRSATVYGQRPNGLWEKKLNIILADKITSAKLIGDGTKLELTTRIGMEFTYIQDSYGHWLLKKRPDQLRYFQC